MITMQEWKEMSGKDKSMWMQDNAKAGNNSFVRRRMSYGIGVFDATYSATKKLDGFTAKCPAYELWQSALCRALSDDYKSKFPSYDGVKICDEWLTFSDFRKWFIEHHVDGWHLDKDLVSNKKLYSPSTSIFVPKWLNLFVNDH